MKSLGILESGRGNILVVKQGRKSESITNTAEMRWGTGSANISTEMAGRFDHVGSIVT